MPVLRKTSSMQGSSQKKSAAVSTRETGGYGSAEHQMGYPIDREEVARLAHSYWEARRGQGGSPESDWLRAEQELRSRAMAPIATAAD